MLLKQTPYSDYRSGLWTANKWLRTAIIALLIFSSLSLSAQPSFAEEIPPAEVVISTPRYEAEMDSFDPSFGKYVYEVSWQSIPAAEVTISLGRVPEGFRVIVTARTNSFVDIFYRLRYRGEARLTSSLLPIWEVINQQENSKFKNSRVDFLPNGSVRSVRWGKGKSQIVQEFTPTNFMLDPFSAALIARSLSWTVGETKEFDTYNGKTRYLISLTAKRESSMKLNGIDRKILVISPTVKKLTNPKAKQKLRDAEIYVTQDERREILEIQSEVFVGSVRTRLKSFSPFPGGVIMGEDGPSAGEQMPPAEPPGSPK